MLITGARLVHPDELWSDAWLMVEGERVARSGRGDPPGRPDVDVGGAVVVPGFVDLHCHGGGRGSFLGAAGAGGAAAVAEGVAHHRRHGTTTTLASLVSDTPDRLRRQVAALAEFVRAGLVAGVHLEGPWLAPARCGAHDPAVLRDPDPGELSRLLAAAGPALKMVTLAPERPGALEVVGLLRRAGIVVAVGHTDATWEETAAAIDAGAQVGTHLGNAMAPLHHRRPGPALALLADPRVVCEAICDGVHLHPAWVRHMAAAGGYEATALITDAVAPKRGADGCLRLGSRMVEAAGEAVRLAGTDILAGSTLTMDGAFARAVAECGFSLSGAVRATSRTPARVLGRNDLGWLRPGARADLVVLGDDYRARRVMAGGVWVEG